MTDAQKKDVCSILALGCDRVTAGRYIGCSATMLRAAMTEDALFAAEVLRSEASAELVHMRNVRTAAQDEKQWRVSVWWLERRAPERYGRRAAGSITANQLEDLLSLLITIVGEEVHEAADRERLLDRLRQVTASLREATCESVPEQVPPDYDEE